MRRNSEARVKARESAKRLVTLALDTRAPLEERRSAAVAACLLISRFGLLSRPRTRGIEEVAPSPPR